MLLLILIFITIPSFILPIHALYFYLDNEKCFYEHLTKDAVIKGDYLLELWSNIQSKFVQSPEMSLSIVVEATRDNHRLLGLRAKSSGKFKFTTAETGEYSICFSTNKTVSNSDPVRLHLEIGAVHVDHDDSDPSLQMNFFLSQAQELNDQIDNIRREQRYQREFEASFYQVSERINRRLFWWSVVQIIVTIGACYVQFRVYHDIFTVRKII
ncbi:uncharacterized protein VTP21DRAFT_11024 [Calcarisporiella thermophila]|uniref:uncharacterized protein n=1 Tax=Calcarisporiella thermophila TaxID=911321 RepID=UPI003743659D